MGPSGDWGKAGAAAGSDSQRSSSAASTDWLNKIRPHLSASHLSPSVMRYDEVNFHHVVIDLVGWMRIETEIEI